VKASATFEQALLPVVSNRLFVFDMDGTLLMKTTACVEIAKVSGTLDQLHHLEYRFASGEIDAFCFAQNIGALWGLVEEQVVRKAFDATPKLTNIEAVTGLIRRGGGKSCLITMSPDFYANLFYDYGFDFIGASRFPRSSDEEIKREHILNPRDKARIVERWCNQLGFELINASHLATLCLITRCSRNWSTLFRSTAMPSSGTWRDTTMRGRTYRMLF
jgi:phosphoserine phosphatase